MSAGFTIRVAEPGDALVITALAGASYPALLRDSYDPSVLAAALPVMTKANPTLLSSGSFYIVFAETGEAVGCGGWSFGRPGSGETEAALAHIRHFATHPHWTRRGVGRLLFRRCEKDVREAGARRFECYSSINAERFYAALGFEAVKVTEISMGEDARMPTVVMQRRI